MIISIPESISENAAWQNAFPAHLLYSLILATIKALPLGLLNKIQKTLAGGPLYARENTHRIFVNLTF